VLKNGLFRPNFNTDLNDDRNDHFFFPDILWKEEQNRVSFGLLAVANGQLALEQKKAAILAKRVETCKQKGASALAEVVSPLAAKLVAVEQELQWKELQGRVSAGLLAASNAQLVVEKKKLPHLTNVSSLVNKKELAP
jgi:hypothetical protein